MWAASAACFAVCVSSAYNTPIFGALFPLVLTANIPPGTLSVQITSLLFAVYVAFAFSEVALSLAPAGVVKLLTLIPAQHERRDITYTRESDPSVKSSVSSL